MNPFEELEKHYPEVIQQMEKCFKAHRFVLALASQHQGSFVTISNFAQLKNVQRTLVFG